VFSALGTTVNAQGLFDVGCDPFGKTAPKCEPCHLLILAKNIINWVIQYSVLAAAAFIFYGGFLLVLKADEKTYSQGKEIIKTVSIGLFWVLGAWLVVNTIFTILTGDFPWQQIKCAPVGGNFIDVYRDAK